MMKLTFILKLTLSTSISKETNHGVGENNGLTVCNMSVNIWSIDSEFENKVVVYNDHSICDIVTFKW